MYKLRASWALAWFLVRNVQAIPVVTPSISFLPIFRARGVDDWKNTLSEDTRHRLEMTLDHLDDKSDAGQAFRNDTIMR